MATMEIWALGNYQRIAHLIAGMGRDLVALAGVGPGQRVLDVAAGTGNATIPAARTGARVTALDSTRQLLDVGRQTAADLPIEWVYGDAIDMPFDNGTFDVVLSCVGAIFAADHETTARELTRVCRPGGLVALANWTPDGSVGRFFAVLARHSPTPAAGPPPTLWGDPAYLRTLFHGHSVETQRRVVEIDFTGAPTELAELYRSSFGPVIAIRDALDSDTARAAFDRDLLDLFTDENEGPTGGPGRWRYPWLGVRIR
jgi:ubiquinone/menaquinone biosynthesis C-methylase UbiE